MQKQEPLIHILHDELVELLQRIMGRFVVFDLYDEKTGSDLLNIKVKEEKNLLPDNKIDVGEGARLALKEVDIVQQRLFTLNAKKFFITVTSYL